MQIILPSYVKTALETLENAGFEAFCVGGAIRDLILSKTPFDFDITTNATPQDIINIFEKTVPTGIKHGTVTVIICGNSIEVTTYRTENGYSDHRSPESVKFLSSVKDDLDRRDFTMNAILYNPKTLFSDPLNGIEDINARLIRAVGDPEKRFTEDALRIMRAFRFSSQLGFEIEEKTKTAALKLSKTVEFLSKERVFSEFKKIILSPYPQNSDPLFKSDAFLELGMKISCNATLKILNGLPLDFALRFAFLSKSFNLDGENILKSLKSDNDTLNNFKKYLMIIRDENPTDKTSLKFILNRYGLSAVAVIINCEHLFFENQVLLRKLLKEILERNEPYEIKHLNINGNDLKQLGFSGANLGVMIDKLLSLCIEDPELNTKEILINTALKLK